MIAEFLISALLLQPPVATQKSYLAWNHDGVSTTNYQLQIDSEAPVVVTPTSTGPNAYRIPFPAVTPGPHTATLKACNDYVCSEPSNVAEFNFVLIPISPTEFRIVIQ